MEEEDKAHVEEAEQDMDDDADDAQPGEKRSRPKGSASGGGEDRPSKRTKEKSEKGLANHHSLSGDPPFQQGSKDRLPKRGQTAHWKSSHRYVDGEVVDIVYEETVVNGKTIKGSEDDPRIVLKSTASGKTAVHKADALYFN